MHTRTFVVVASWVSMVAALIVLLLLVGYSLWGPVPAGEDLRDNLLAGGLLVLVLVAVILLAWADVRRGQREIRTQLGAMQAALTTGHREPLRTRAYVGRAVVPSSEDVDTAVVVHSAQVRRRRRRQPEQVEEGLTPEMVQIARRVDRRLRGS